jgi:hypothetical protein
MKILLDSGIGLVLQISAVLVAAEKKEVIPKRKDLAVFADILFSVVSLIIAQYFVLSN